MTVLVFVSVPIGCELAPPPPPPPPVLALYVCRQLFGKDGAVRKLVFFTFRCYFLPGE